MHVHTGRDIEPICHPKVVIGNLSAIHTCRDLEPICDTHRSWLGTYLRCTRKSWLETYLKHKSWLGIYLSSCKHRSWLGTYLPCTHWSWWGTFLSHKLWLGTYMSCSHRSWLGTYLPRTYRGCVPICHVTTGRDWQLICHPQVVIGNLSAVHTCRDLQPNMYLQILTVNIHVAATHRSWFGIYLSPKGRDWESIC